MSTVQQGKAIIIAALTSETVYEDFESISIVDAGATDGFNIVDEKGNEGFIPTGVPISIGGPGPKTSNYLKVKPASGKSLNATVILYQ